MATCAGRCPGRPVSKGLKGLERGYCNSIISNYNFKELPLPKRQLQKPVLISPKNKASGIKNILTDPLAPGPAARSPFSLPCGISLFNVPHNLSTPADGHLLQTMLRGHFSTRLPGLHGWADLFDAGNCQIILQVAVTGHGNRELSPLCILGAVIASLLLLFPFAFR